MRTRNHRCLIITGLTLLLFLLGDVLIAQTPKELKPRIIVLTDLKRVHETDDCQSLVRLLTYADQFEIEGLVVNSGYNYWRKEHLDEGYEYLREILDAYEASVPNLMKMHRQDGFILYEHQQEYGYFPSPDYLRGRTAAGNPLVGLEQVGLGKQSEGSELIIKVVDEEDERPVYILIWGGGNVLAQALWDISENPYRKRSDEGKERFIGKLRILSILDQDMAWSKRNNSDQSGNSHFWIRERFPGIFWVRLTPAPFSGICNGYNEFYQHHIQGHTGLGNAYPDHSNSVEGDTPALLYLMQPGFSAPEHPEWGNMSGLYTRTGHRYQTQFFDNEDPEVRKSNEVFASRWIDGLWNDFAARMDWARGGTGNRPPVIDLNGIRSDHIMRIQAKPGQAVKLDASASFDRESDDLSFRWSVLQVPGALDIAGIEPGNEHPSIQVIIPGDSPGGSIHILLELTDDGAGHPLTTLRRVVIGVSDENNAAL